MNWPDVRLKKPYCPQCNLPACSITEAVLVEIGLTAPDADGDIEYDGDYGDDPEWDSSEPLLDGRGQVTVRCMNSHQWKTSIKE